MAKKDKKNIKKKYSSVQVGLISVLALILIALLGVVVSDRLDSRSAKNAIMKSFNEYYGRDELTLIYLTSSECSFCAIQTPILEKIVQEYKIDYLEIDKTEITEKQLSKIVEKLNIDKAAPTPTTLIVKNGKVVKAHTGLLEGHKYVEFLIEGGILNKDAKYVPEQYLTFIDYAEFEELKKNTDASIVVLGSSTCTYCATAKPILSNIAKAYNIDIYYLTLNYISSEERKLVFEEIIDMGIKDPDYLQSKKLSTPTILIVKNGKIVDEAIGLLNVTDYVKLFKDNNIIKE